MYLYVACDEDGDIRLFDEEPERDEDEGYWTSDGPGFSLDASLFPDLIWEDEPLEVRLVRDLDENGKEVFMFKRMP